MADSQHQKLFAELDQTAKEAYQRTCDDMAKGEITLLEIMHESFHHGFYAGQLIGAFKTMEQMKQAIGGDKTPAPVTH